MVILRDDTRHMTASTTTTVRHALITRVREGLAASGRACFNEGPVPVDPHLHPVVVAVVHDRVPSRRASHACGNPDRPQGIHLLLSLGVVVCVVLLLLLLLLWLS